MTVYFINFQVRIERYRKWTWRFTTDNEGYHAKVRGFTDQQLKEVEQILCKHKALKEIQDKERSGLKKKGEKPEKLSHKILPSRFVCSLCGRNCHSSKELFSHSQCINGTLKLPWHERAQGEGTSIDEVQDDDVESEADTCADERNTVAKERSDLKKKGEVQEKLSHQLLPSRFVCSLCDRNCHSSIGLFSHSKKCINVTRKLPWYDKALEVGTSSDEGMHDDANEKMELKKKNERSAKLRRKRKPPRFVCPLCGRNCYAFIGLMSHRRKCKKINMTKECEGGNVTVECKKNNNTTKERKINIMTNES